MSQAVKVEVPLLAAEENCAYARACRLVYLDSPSSSMCLQCTEFRELIWV